MYNKFDGLPLLRVAWWYYYLHQLPCLRPANIDAEISCCFILLSIDSEKLPCNAMCICPKERYAFFSEYVMGVT